MGTKRSSLLALENLSIDIRKFAHMQTFTYASRLVIMSSNSHCSQTKGHLRTGRLFTRCIYPTQMFICIVALLKMLFTHNSLSHPAYMH